VLLGNLGLALITARAVAELAQIVLPRLACIVSNSTSIRALLQALAIVQ
jgi:hypothetical protein